MAGAGALALVRQVAALRRVSAGGDTLLRGEGPAHPEVEARDAKVGAAEVQGVEDAALRNAREECMEGLGLVLELELLVLPARACSGHMRAPCGSANTTPKGRAPPQRLLARLPPPLRARKVLTATHAPTAIYANCRRSSRRQVPDPGS